MSLVLTSTGAWIAVGGIRSFRVPWRRAQMIIQQIFKMWTRRPRPPPVVWPALSAGLATRPGLTIWRPWMTLAIAVGGVGAIIGGYNIITCIHVQLHNNA